MPPKHQTPEARAKIGAGVRKGEANKVPLNVRIDPAVRSQFRALVARDGRPLAQCVEEAVMAWRPPQR